MARESAQTQVLDRDDSVSSHVVDVVFWQEKTWCFAILKARSTASCCSHDLGRRSENNSGTEAALF